MVEILLKDGTSFETPDENLTNVERLMGDKIKDVKYSTSPIEDAINKLAAEQAALWNKSEQELTPPLNAANDKGNGKSEAPIKQKGRPKKSTATK